MPSKNPQPGCCGAKIRKSQAKYGEVLYCTNKAGKGTDHVGEGRCKFHGGATPPSPQKSIERAVEKIKKDLIPENYQDFKELPPEIKLDMERELHAGRLLFQEVQKQLKGLPLDVETVAVHDFLLKVGEYNRKTIESLLKNQYAGLSKVQIQVFYGFIKLAYYRIVSDERLGMDSPEKAKRVRDIIESSAQDALSGSGQIVDTEYSIVEHKGD